ncbi:MAG: DUF4097 family beta strand repeat-containing protein [Candidatus Poribacteria bacterium]|nr:DUF4097 family beta strand repeat-containing protein [Candidatus Poribacteria bacterium]
MSQERLEILRMLSEGKISASEAEMLLRALSDTSDASEKPGTKAQKPKEFVELFQDIGQEIKQEVGRAIESVQRSDIGKVVSEVVGDVVVQVKTTVSDVLDNLEKTDEKRKIEEQLEWTFDGAGVSKIDAQTVNGSISLAGSDRDQVIVRAWKEVRSKSAADAEEFAQKVNVYAEQHGDEIRIYREYPKPPEGVSVTVRYEIESPREVDVNLRTVNNGLQISGIAGAIDAATVNRAIKLQGDTGPIHAHTTNGDIGAMLGHLAHESKFSTTNGLIDVKIGQGIVSLTATTTNGEIDLTLPEDFAGQLDAKTSQGSVQSDFPIPVTRKIKNRLEGQIGEGGEALVKLRSLNGSIHLRQQQ